MYIVRKSDGESSGVVSGGNYQGRWGRVENKGQQRDYGLYGAIGVRLEDGNGSVWLEAAGMLQASRGWKMVGECCVRSQR